MHSFTCWLTGREQIFVYNLYTFFVEYNVLVLSLQHFTFVQNQIVLTTMKRMLNRMLRYADAIVKRGVDKLIDAIGHNAEPQTEDIETPQQQKRMGNDTDCAPQTTGNTTNCGLTEQAITLTDELYDIRFNVLDRTPEVQRHDQVDKGLVPVSTDALWRMAFGRWLRCMVVQAKKQVLFCSFKGCFPLCHLPRDT
jgi:hypothetical protein